MKVFGARMHTQYFQIYVLCQIQKIILKKIWYLNLCIKKMGSPWSSNYYSHSSLASRRSPTLATWEYIYITKIYAEKMCNKIQWNNLKQVIVLDFLSKYFKTGFEYKLSYFLLLSFLSYESCTWHYWFSVSWMC